MKKLIILTGAGISAESGIKTFRETGGLWEEHDVMEVASPEGWRKNRELVLQFYNERRKALSEVDPNEAHKALVELEKVFDVMIITQNVDDLHERAGSSSIIHLHGELLKARSTRNPSLVYHWDKDINPGDTCETGSQLRPHIVWFGEAVPMLQTAALEISTADIVIIIGTSMQVYPAASLVGYAPSSARIFYIDLHPSTNYELSISNDLTVIEAPATEGVRKIVDDLITEEEEGH